MLTVQSRKLLKDLTDQFVLVTRDNMIYQRVDTEYIPKPYFTSAEAKDILDAKSLNEIHKICTNLGIQARANKRKKLRITLPQLRKIAIILKSKH